MNCDSVKNLISLYYYGELTPDQEDELDEHLHECPACSHEMEAQRTLTAALERRQLDLPPLLLEDCRADLMAAIAGGAPRQIIVKPSAKGPWTLFLEAMAATFASMGRLRQPVGALLLVVLGYMGARFTGTGAPAIVAPSDNVYANVRSIRQEPDGRVHIMLDETRQREVLGRPEDDNIKKIILAASRQNDAAVRVESVGLLKNSAGPEVMESLMNALDDVNDGVRLRALDALQPMAANPQVTKKLASVLLTDANPAVRTRVIDLMVARRDDSTVGLFQNVIQREDNNGVRLKVSKILKDWNASIGSF